MNKFGIALAALSLAATTASAATIDVDNLLVGETTNGSTGLAALSALTHPDFPRTMYAYQTWTVGQAGKLAQVDLVSSPSSAYSDDGGFYTGGPPFPFDVTLTILGGGTAFTPGNVVLGSITMSANDIVGQGVTAFDFSDQHIAAAAGTLLTWRMSVEACPALYCAQVWSNTNDFSFSGGGNTNGYAGGGAFVEENGVLYNFSHVDLNFRTWMAAVPEPGTWSLMILGFMGVGGALRRQRPQIA
jgi:hypothetical protein